MKAKTGQFSGFIGRILLAVAVVVATLAAGRVQLAIAATQIDIAGPAGSEAFGTSVTVLPNGNIVVTDPYYDLGPIADVGAVYLYDGATGAQISMLTGSTANDLVGWSPYPGTQPAVAVLSNGNYVVVSPFWGNGAGAVTWGSGITGVDGVVSAANSLVGGSADDHVGLLVTALGNGNYVVCSHNWDNGAAVDAGAVTWGSGTTGISGVVSVENSLVGSTAGDLVGCAGLNCFDAVTALSNGNYLVGSPYWDDGAVEDAGAATWCDGTTGRVGVVSAANSLVGDTTGDRIGFLVTPLSNGNYVVRSPSWHNGAGAATWGSGTTDISGAVSAANSLVGSTAGDEVGYSVTVLSNGNYVVPSPDWDNDLVTDAGAVTWGSGTTGVKGMVSAANSLVGSTAGDRIGEGPLGVTTLKNGNYVVRSPTWDTSTVADVGAVTWGSGTTGIAGVVSAANSLVGSTAGDQVGCGSEFCDVEGVTALSNGNYVVVSIYWDNGAAADAGAVTWGEGSTGVMGVVSAVNSLVGTSADDRVGCAEADFCYGLVALNNGNYVVKSPWWDNGAAADAGAVTWGSGTAGVRGAISAANSLVGSFADDRVGCGNVYCAAGVTTLSNGNYVVRSLDWNNGTGAVTWGGGTSGVSGVVSAANSLVGHGGCGYVGEWVTPLTNGNYVVRSPECDIGGAWDAGAVTWGNGTTGTSGAIFEDNSLVGSTDGDGVGAGVTALTNGNYVVRSPHWHNGAVEDAGAVTWGNGSNGTVGAVSAANSLVGSTTDDGVGRYIVALSNGNYLVVNPYWDNGAAWDAGAVTWGNGTTGTSGAISEANSLVGSTVGDRLGCQDDYCTWPYVMALSSGSYVLSSPLWDNGVIVDAGAVTWGDRTGGTVGPIMAENSVRGTAASGGPSIVWAYDAVNRQLVVGRPADNIVTLFRLPPAYPVFLPVMLKNAP